MSLKNVAINGCLGLIASIALWSACGPSIRRTYQSDNAFEHCFDQDFDSQTADATKSACWGDWLSKHVYNQPDDKIRYLYPEEAS